MMKEGAGVLDDAGFAGLYQGLLDAGYDLGSLEDLLAEMGGTSFGTLWGGSRGCAQRMMVLTWPMRGGGRHDAFDRASPAPGSPGPRSWLKTEIAFVSPSQMQEG